jgi:septum formation protein
MKKTAGQKTKIKWILASASPRRREILSSLGMSFTVEPSSIPEDECLPALEPAICAKRLAKAKALHIGRKHKSGVVIGADTIVIVQNRILGKPADDRDARTMLRRLSGRWHEVITGICLYDCKTGLSVSGCSRSRVRFRRLKRADIDWYLGTREHQDKAGAYGIQGHGSLLIDRIEGCYFNIVGFPVATFFLLGRRMGINILHCLDGGRGGQ